jgi:hypothetical protein
MMQNQGLFKHPEDEIVNTAYWKTTAWNAAWTAAEQVMGRM